MRPHSDTDRHVIPGGSRGECSNLLVCAVAAVFVLVIGLLLLAVSVAL
jgi:hypothetical protein